MNASSLQVEQLIQRLLAPADALPEPVAAIARSLAADEVNQLLERLSGHSGELVREEVQLRLLQILPKLVSQTVGSQSLSGNREEKGSDPKSLRRLRDLASDPGEERGSDPKSLRGLRDLASDPGGSQTGSPLDGELLAERVRLIEELWRVTPREALLASLWLMWLASLPQPELSLRAWADAIVARPPQAVAGIDRVVGPVLRRSDLPDGLLAGLVAGTLADPVVAPAVLDLCNFRFREKFDAVHAATGLLDRLARLLPTVVQGLLRVEEGHLPPGGDAAAISQNINHSVALSIALCDTLGQCGYRAGEGGLRQALGLRHRRVQTEAAAALARLDVAAGRETLVRLAGEPLARLRVLAFARELGLLESIPEEQRSEVAVAESRLVNWLAEPAQMGLAPSRTELVERHALFWPGQDQPVECLLFRYEYGSQFSSFGLVGPSVQGLLFDAGWMTGEDLFAAFAGMAAGHEDLFTVSAADFSSTHPAEMQRLLRRLADGGFVSLQPAIAGHFFGTWLLVCSAERQGAGGLVAINGTPRWFPAATTGQLVPELVWAIESGRRLLESFNQVREEPEE